MGWFKKLTGVSSKGIVQAAGAAAGAYFGGPEGAAAGYNLGGALTGDENALNNLVSGAVGLGTDYLQSQYNLKQQKELATHVANEQGKLNEQAYQRNLQQWNLENFYNSPAEQMKRFEQAGLNKNLIYGQQNTAGSSPTLQPATYNPGQYHPVDKSAQRQALQLALMEHKARIENQAIENDLARQRLVLAARDADRSDALAKAQIQAIGANLGLTEARTHDIDLKDRRTPQEKALGFLDTLYNVGMSMGEKFYNWNKSAGAGKDYDNSFFHKATNFIRNF